MCRRPRLPNAPRPRPTAFRRATAAGSSKLKRGSTAGTKSREHGLRPTAAKRPTRTRRWYPAIAKSVTHVPRTRRVPRPTSTAMGAIARQRMWRKLRASSASRPTSSSHRVIARSKRSIARRPTPTTSVTTLTSVSRRARRMIPGVGSLANQTSTPDGPGSNRTAMSGCGQPPMAVGASF